VDLIRTYSNKPHLKLRYADLRKLLQQAEPRPPEPQNIGRTRPRKRRLTRTEIDQIIAKYQSGASTNQLKDEHHLGKDTISALLRANGVAMRRQGLTPEQAWEAAGLYRAGRSLKWIGQYFGGISPTTIARALRNQGVTLRPRRGST
jgi:hypothetical protein